MELYLVESDCDKVKGLRNWWHSAVVLVGLLLALNVAAFLAELSQDCVRTSVKEWIITLGVKFLNFGIAKAVQFRFAHPLQARPSFMPLLFWSHWHALSRLCTLDCLLCCPKNKYS